MKKTVLVILSALEIAAAAAQTEKAGSWDSTFRPNNFSLKAELFRSLPNSKKDIIFLGNSITAGVDWNELLQLNNARNRGISGDITFGVLERLEEVVEGQPAKVFILIGINDISRNIPDSLIVANFKKMVLRIRKGSPKTKIYLHTLLPVNNTFTPFKNHYNKDEHIRFVNEELKKIVDADNKIVLIDLHPKFIDSNGRLIKEFTEDGLHLNAAGYKHWAAILKSGNYLK